MKKISVTTMAGLFLLSGCAHSLMRGTVAMKINDQEGHVCMGKDEVKAGDRVGFFVNHCTGSGGGRDGGGRSCELVKIGEGKVVEPLNDHYSVVRANPGVKLDEGTIVEKL
jgi:hypothetical protein